MFVKAVIFDLDGTLVNSLEDIAMSMNIVLKNHHFPTHSLTDYQGFIGHGIRDLVSKAVPVTHKQDAFIASTLQEMMEVYGEHCTQNTKMYAGISELLTALSTKAIPLAVFSNKAELLTKKVVSEVLSNWQFGQVIGLTTEALKKPNPNKAMQIAKELGIAPKDILFVGDSEVDMQTAKDANMQAVGVLWGFRTQEELEESGADFMIAHPLELLSIIKEQ